MTAISINDVLINNLSGGLSLQVRLSYPLGYREIIFSLMLVTDGGWVSILRMRTHRPCT